LRESRILSLENALLRKAGAQSLEFVVVDDGVSARWVNDVNYKPGACQTGSGALSSGAKQLIQGVAPHRFDASSNVTPKGGARASKHWRGGTWSV